MAECVVTSKSLQDTDRFGRICADVLPAGTTVALVGTLGAGKTRLVQAIAAALDIDRNDVTSPTFVLCQEYHGTRAIYHMDAYRVQDEDEFLELGPSEYFESPGITLVEWADRVRECLPSDYIEIRIDVTGETARRLTVTAIGDRYAATIDLLRQRLGP